MCQRAGQLGRTLRIGQKPDEHRRHLHPAAAMMTADRLERALRDGELDLAAGTAWLWARPGLAGSVDTPFVDEAGQLSLANVLAVAGAARNLVLLGDPQQLAQPSQATHLPGAGSPSRRCAWAWRSPATSRSRRTPVRPARPSSWPGSSESC